MIKIPTKKAILGRRLKLLILFSMFSLFYFTTNAQVSLTATTGTASGSFTTLKAAFDAINAGTHGGVITVSVTGNVTETSSAILNASGSGSASYTSISITPSGGSWTISGGINGALIDLNGADNVTIDGLNTGGNALTISNTSTGATSTIRFISDASSNTITNCTINGSASTASNAVINFSTGSSTGNDNNTVSYCNIGPAGSNLPINSIFSLGTSAAIDNSSNNITNNNIYDFFSAASASTGINLSNTNANSSSGWTISNNKIYQTANRIYTTGNTHQGILIGGGSGFTINNNTIGFANSSGTGTTNMIGNSVNLSGFPGTYTTTGTSNTTRYVAISAAFAAAGTVSNIQGNTIGGFALYTSSGANTTTGIWCGIAVTSGNANIGTSSGNTIGTTSGTNSIYTASTTAGSVAVGIYVTSVNTVSIQNNNIGGVTTTGTSATGASGFAGIDCAGALGVFNISSNTIGNSTANNIRTGYYLTSTSLSNVATTATSASGTSTIVGIRSTATGATLTISSNTIRGIQVSGTATTFTGIISSGAITSSVTINSNSLGTSSTGLITYTFANSGALLGISCTGSTAATSHSIQSNDFRGITNTVAGSQAQTYVTFTAGSAAGNVSTLANNTFTNLSVNTTGTIIFFSHSYAISATGTFTLNNNSIVTAFARGSAGQTTISSTGSTSGTGSIANYTNNNFSNITVTGGGAITGFTNTDGGTGSTKTITGNTFSNWTTGVAAILAMNFSYWNGTSTLSDNTISNLAGQGAITGVAINSTANNATLITVNNNSINTLVSSGAGGSVVGITCGNTSTQINISNNTIHTLSSTGSTSTISGLTIAGATLDNIFRNKIYNISGSAAGSIVNGITITSGTTLNIYNNVIGDLKATAATGLNAINGINITATGTYNIYFNTIVLNATSSSVTTFGSSCITFGTTGTLTLRNNILVNVSTPGSEVSNLSSNGISAILRRSSGTAATIPSNYSSSSNKNLVWVNPSAGTNNHMYYVEGTSTLTNPMNTLAAYKTFMSTKDQASIEEQLGTTVNNLSYFASTTGSNSQFLRIADATSTQAESGADVISTPSITTDYVGIAGNRATTPDIGAYEFAGVSPAPTVTLNSITPSSNQCAATARLVSVDVTTPSGTISGVNIVYNNGAGNTTVAMTNTTGNTWEYTIPAASPSNTAVTWSVTATNSISLSKSLTGSVYQDDPLFGVSSAITASANPICIGSNSNLTATLTKAGSATVGAGASTSAGTAASFLPGGWGGAKTQFIVKASELTAMGLSAGNITSLGFYPTTAGQTYQGFSVRIGHTAQSAMTTSFITSGLTQVYLGTLTNDGFLPVANTVNTLSFGTGTGSSSAFNWDGTSNIVISISWSLVPAASTSTSSTMQVDATGFTCSAYDQADNLTPANMLASITADGTGTSRPKFIFAGNTSPVITSLSWSDGSSTVSTSNPASVSASSTTTYTASIVSSGCTVTPSPSITLNVATPPAAPTATNAVSCPGVPTASISSNTAAVGPNFKWYDVSVGGSALQTSTSTTYTSSISATDTFYVTEVDGATSCESSRTPVIATVNSLSISPVSASFCAGAGAQTDSFYVSSSHISFPTLTWTALTPSAILSTTSGSSTMATITETSDFSVEGSGAGCTQTAYVSIGVYDFPTPVLTATPNDTICLGSQVTFNSGLSAGNFSVSTITNSPLTAPVSATNLVTNGNTTAPNGTPLSGGTLDDGGWGNIPIGFNFNFFGSTYNKIAVGTNGTLMFGTVPGYGTTAGQLGQFNFSLTPTAFPNSGNPGNVVALVSQDNQLGTSGNVKYWTTGFAPNRKFVVQFTSVPEYSGTGSTTAQAVFFETTGIVEIHITNASTSTSRAKIVGLQDSTKTIGAAPVNGTTANISNTAYRFSPPSNYNTVWTPAQDISGVNSGLNLFTRNSNYNAVSSNTVYLTLTNTVTGCSNASNPASLNIEVIDPPVDPITAGNTICGPKASTVSVINSASFLPADSVRWYDAATNGNFLGYGLTYTTPVLNSTTTFYAETWNGYGVNTGGRVAATVTFSNPPSFAVSSNQASCFNTAATISVTTGGASYTNVTWSPITDLFDDALCTSPITALGSYSTVYCKPGSSGTVSFTASGSNAAGCASTSTTSVTMLPDPSTVTLVPVTDTLCNSGLTTIDVSPISGYSPATIQWLDNSNNVIAGQTGVSYTIPYINSSSTYTFQVLNSSNSVCISAATTITVDSIIPPTVTPSSHCGTQIPTCSASGAGVGQVYRWYTTAVGGIPLTGENGSTLSSYSVSSTTTFYVSITDYTCESGRTPVTVTVTTPDAITASNNLGTNICLGSSANISVTQASSNNTYSLTWTSSDYTNSGMSSSTSTSLNNPMSITPTAIGTYIFTITGVETGSGCTAVDYDTLVVINPFASITPVASASPSTVCAGSPTNVSVNVGMNGTLPISAATTTEFGGGVYRLGFGTGDFRHQLIYTAAELTAAGIQAGNLTAITFNVSSVGSGTANNYTISLANITGTTLTTTFNTSALTQVYTASTYTPVSGANTHSFNTPFYWNGTSDLLVNICYNVSSVGGSSTLSATTPASVRNVNLLGSAGACSATTGTTYANRPTASFTYIVGTIVDSYSWSDGLTTVGTTNPLAVSPLTNTIYTVTLNRLGCTTTANVNVNPVSLPTAPSVTSSSHCGNQIPTCSASGGSAGEYRWYTQAVGGTSIPSENNGTFTSYYVSVTDTFFVAINNGTCESTRSQVIVNVSTPDAVVANASSVSNVCANTNLTLSASQSLSNNTYTLTWTSVPAVGSGIATSASGSLSSSTIVTPTASGTYTYTLTGIEGSTGCQVIDTVNVTVIHPFSGVTSNAFSSESSVCAGSPTILSARTTNSAPNVYSTPAVTNPTTDEDIDSVVISQSGTPIINNLTTYNSLSGTLGTATGTAGSFSNFTAFGPFAFTAGQTYDFAVRSADAPTYYNNGMAIFIDYNRDGDFDDSGEKVFTSAALVLGPHTVTGSFTIPIDAANGLTRMRVMNKETALLVNATDAISYGEVEDYLLDISSSYNYGGPVPSGITYSWSNGSTTVGSSNPLSVSPVSASTYTATLSISGCSIVSSPVSVSINPAAATPATPSVSNNTTTGFDLSWSAAANATSYKLDVATDALFASMVSGYNDLTVAGLSQSVTGLTAGTTYYARVRAINTCGASSNSSTLTTITKTVAPVLSAASGVSTTGMTINWSAVTGAASYLLDVSTSNNFNTFVSGYNGLAVSSGTSQAVTGLSAGTRYYFRVLAVNAGGNSAYSSTGDTVTLSGSATLSLTAFFEGLYLGSGTMTSAPYNSDNTLPATVADTITVELHSANGTFDLAYSVTDTISVNGTASISLPGAAVGNYYYIVIKHRNSVETWSGDSVLIGSSTSYDFSSAATQAYGSNMVNLGSGVYGIYSGDINQDGSVDFLDYPDLDLGSINGDIGYFKTDLNGDSSVDFLDYPLIDLNSINGVFLMKP